MLLLCASVRQTLLLRVCTRKPQALMHRGETSENDRNFKRQRQGHSRKPL